MKLISWNINGIRSVLKKGFEAWLEKQNDADFICLQETRALEDQVPADIWNVPGYHCSWNPAEKKGYSGVATWSKQQPLEVIYGLGDAEFDSEGRVIQSVYKDFVLFNIYFPNGSSSDERLDFKMRFYDKYLEVANKWVAAGKNVITCGDYNTCHQEIDIARPKANAKRSGFLPIEREWMDKMIAEGYVDTFRDQNPDQKDAYTWWSNRGGARERNVGWRIDYFFVNDALKGKVKKAGISPEVQGSDHCPIYLDLDLDS